MNEAIIQRWNARVQDDDIGYILGDLNIDSRWKEGLECASQLKGRKVLILGNHDRRHPGHRAGEWLKVAAAYNSVFEVVDTIGTVRFGKKVALLSHFPYKDDEDDRFSPYRLRSEGLPLIHGHTHRADQTLSPDGLSLHVGFEAWPDGPVSETTVADLLNL